MKLTNERIEQILDGVPDKQNEFKLGATHYDLFNGDYFIMWAGSLSGVHSSVWDGYEWVEDDKSNPIDPVLLDSLRTILDQTREISRLREIARKTINNMEYAAFNLCETMDLVSRGKGRVVESTCPETSLLIAIRDLKEVTQPIKEHDDE